MFSVSSISWPQCDRPSRARRTGRGPHSSSRRTAARSALSRVWARVAGRVSGERSPGGIASAEGALQVDHHGAEQCLGVGIRSPPSGVYGARSVHQVEALPRLPRQQCVLAVRVEGVFPELLAVPDLTEGAQPVRGSVEVEVLERDQGVRHESRDPDHLFEAALRRPRRLPTHKPRPGGADLAAENGRQHPWRLAK